MAEGWSVKRQDVMYNHFVIVEPTGEGDPKLFNQYGVILVNAKHPNVKAKDGQAFIDWLTGSEGQAAIASYKIDGQQLFFPNARPQR